MAEEGESTQTPRPLMKEGKQLSDRWLDSLAMRKRTSSDAHRTSESTTTELEALRKQLDQRDHDILQAVEFGHQLLERNVALENEMQSLREAMKVAEEQVRSKENETVGAQTRLFELKYENKAMVTACTRLRNEKNEAKAAMAELESKIARLEDDSRALQSHKEALATERETNERLRDKVAELIEEVDVYRSELETARRGEGSPTAPFVHLNQSTDSQFAAAAHAESQTDESLMTNHVDTERMKEELARHKEEISYMRTEVVQKQQLDHDARFLREENERLVREIDEYRGLTKKYKRRVKALEERFEEMEEAKLSANAKEGQNETANQGQVSFLEDLMSTLQETVLRDKISVVADRVSECLYLVSNAQNQLFALAEQIAYEVAFLNDDADPSSSTSARETPHHFFSQLVQQHQQQSSRPQSRMQMVMSPTPSQSPAASAHLDVIRIQSPINVPPVVSIPKSSSTQTNPHFEDIPKTNSENSDKGLGQQQPSLDGNNALRDLVKITFENGTVFYDVSMVDTILCGAMSALGSLSQFLAQIELNGEWEDDSRSSTISSPSMTPRSVTPLHSVTHSKKYSVGTSRSQTPAHFQFSTPNGGFSATPRSATPFSIRSAMVSPVPQFDALSGFVHVPGNVTPGSSSALKQHRPPKLNLLTTDSIVPSSVANQSASEPNQNVVLAQTPAATALNSSSSQASSELSPESQVSGKTPKTLHFEAQTDTVLNSQASGLVETKIQKAFQVEFEPQPATERFNPTEFSVASPIKSISADLAGSPVVHQKTVNHLPQSVVKTENSIFTQTEKASQSDSSTQIEVHTAQKSPVNSSSAPSRSRSPSFFWSDQEDTPSNEEIPTPPPRLTKAVFLLASVGCQTEITLRDTFILEDAPRPRRLPDPPMAPIPEHKLQVWDRLAALWGEHVNIW